MSQLLITQYLNKLDRLRKTSGTNRETVVREAFKDLLKSRGKTRELQFIAEYRIVTAAKNQISLDGALLHSLRVPFGYWESKDTLKTNGKLRPRGGLCGFTDCQPPDWYVISRRIKDVAD
jgi:hypothetical protein